MFSVPALLAVACLFNARYLNILCSCVCILSGGFDVTQSDATRARLTLFNQFNQSLLVQEHMYDVCMYV